LTEFTTLFPNQTAAAPNAAVGATSNTSPAVAGLRIPMRPLKMGIGLTLLMAGAYGVLSDRRFLSTDSAVVTAYLTEVRTPIDGTLTGMPDSAGGIAAQGVIIGAVDNLFFDQQPISNQTRPLRTAKGEDLRLSSQLQPSPYTPAVEIWE
jgi:hypothetical protein